MVTGALVVKHVTHTRAQDTEHEWACADSWSHVREEEYPVNYHLSVSVPWGFPEAT